MTPSIEEKNRKKKEEIAVKEVTDPVITDNDTVDVKTETPTQIRLPAWALPVKLVKFFFGINLEAELNKVLDAIFKTTERDKLPVHMDDDSQAVIKNLLSDDNSIAKAAEDTAESKSAKGITLHFKFTEDGKLQLSLEGPKNAVKDIEKEIAQQEQMPNEAQNPVSCSN